MITPTAFKVEWNKDSNSESLQLFPSSALDGIDIPDTAKKFLIEAGLPDSAAPFLTFGPATIFLESDMPLPDLVSTWGLSEAYKVYHEIGSAGGDPICMEEPTGKIICFNHDNHFAPTFVNSSVFQLAESLLAFRSYVQQVRNESGPEGGWREKVQDQLKTWIAAELKRIDAEAVQKNTFWEYEVFHKLI